jgi:hypothetical protein
VLAGLIVTGIVPPEMELVETLSTALVNRIEHVLVGEPPMGIQEGLPLRILPLFPTWPWPGKASRGTRMRRRLWE